MKRPLALFVLLSGLATSATACEFFLGETKTSQGQLYTSGDSRYDPFFDTVHKEQIAATSWVDDAKTSRKPIVTALNLKPGASNSTILSATRETKSGAAALGLPIEQTTAAENERAKRLTAEAKRLADLKEQGESLRRQASEDKKNLGAKKADEKAVEKKDEVKRELGAAIDVLDKLTHEARTGAKEAEELAAKLTAAWTGHPEDEKAPAASAAASAAPPAASASAAKKPEAKKPEAKKPAAGPEAKKPAAAEPKPAAETPPAKPPPAQKPPDEVFNP